MSLATASRPPARVETHSTPTPAGLTAILAGACRDISFEGLPPAAVFLAKQCILDWLGVTMAGYTESLAVILREQALEDGGASQATLVGSGERVSAAQAALVNGAASHALDFDDVHIGMSGHPTVPVLPAVLALAERTGASGGDVIAAFVAGFEMECRIGAYVMPGHYQRGFHATGTLGAFGAAAACAHLLGLDTERWGHALGIAGAQAAGLKSMFGTMCKPLHAGKAAQNGLNAALLAARGFTSNPAVIETEQGFGATQAPSVSVERALAGLGDDLAINGVLFKYHAACYGTHETIENLLVLRELPDVTPEAVESIELRVPRGHLAMCNIQEPATPLEGKFSLRFTAAMALADGDLSERAFTPARVADPRFTSLRDRVTVVPHSGDHFEGGSETVLRLRSGAVHRRQTDLNVPASDLDRQWQRLGTKFLTLAIPVVGPTQARLIVDAVQSFDHHDQVRDLVALCVAATGDNP